MWRRGNHPAKRESGVFTEVHDAIRILRQDSLGRE